MNAQVVTVSTKGQIAIPVSMRRDLDIDAGDKLVAYTSGDVIMLKVLKIPKLDEFEQALNEAQEWAKDVGYVESDVNDIIKETRKSKRL
ncbi:spoVT/AbrB domain-containing protein [Clostridium sp. CAG:411]|nr:AbrB/MazE/SpoVT family DNA-binding domain-containing protein [Lachnospiraceae bacterium]CDE45975.1 spoVT/AbrB domain-containing protein [Clostridium sp. CAG:411]